MKKIKQAVFNKLPATIQGNIIRSSIQIPLVLSDNLTFKIANTAKELEEAYSVLHDAYVEQTFITPTSNGMRIVSHHVLPTTTTIVGKIDDQVVGTLSIIKSGVLGIPMEKNFDISEFKKGNQTYAEISALAIRKEFRREQGGSIFFPLVKYMFEYCTEFFNVENLLIVIHPKDEAFYAGLLFFKKLPNTDVIDYMGTPAISLCLNLKYAVAKTEEFYKGKSPEQNMYSFFVETKFPQFQFPKRDFLVTNDSIINEKIFKEFFIDRGQLFEHISLKDFLVLKEYYWNTSVAKIFINYMNLQNVARSFHRYNVKMKGILKDSDQNFIVVDVSKQGLQVKSFFPFESSLIYHLGININHTKQIFIKASLVRDNRNFYAFTLVEENKEWTQFIDELETLHFTNKVS